MTEKSCCTEVLPLGGLICILATKSVHKEGFSSTGDGTFRFSFNKSCELKNEEADWNHATKYYVNVNEHKDRVSLPSNR